VTVARRQCVALVARWWLGVAAVPFALASRGMVWLGLAWQTEAKVFDAAINMADGVVEFREHARKFDSPESVRALEASVQVCVGKLKCSAPARPTAWAWLPPCV
jgi:hypothetical protein